MASLFRSVVWKVRNAVQSFGKKCPPYGIYGKDMCQTVGSQFFSPICFDSDYFPIIFSSQDYILNNYPSEPRVFVFVFLCQIISFIFSPLVDLQKICLRYANTEHCPNL